jgi:NADPH:quinone reductase-like Zn-dependent oxidoreductase
MITRERYGATDVLELRDVPPSRPGAGQVLVRVEAAALNPYDWHAMVGLPYFARAQFGWRRPRADGLGGDFAGRIEAAGPDVTGLAEGDAVFGLVGHTPDGSTLALGTLSTQLCIAADRVRRRPDHLDAAGAAALPLAGITALRAVRDAGAVGPGDRVLVNGASGGVGTFAVQIAKALGGHVTGVCSTRNLELVRSLGADEVVDYTSDDPTAGDTRYDLVLDNVGNHPTSRWRRVLADDGLYLASFDHPERRLLGPMAAVARMSVGARVHRRRMTMLNWSLRPDDLDALADLVDDGSITPVVCCTFPLAQTCEAMEHLASRRARGKIIITMEDTPWGA